MRGKGSIRPKDVRKFEEWLDQGAGAFAAGLTLNSCDFTLPKAIFFWEKGWQGVEIDEALRDWKRHVSEQHAQDNLARSVGISSELFHC